MPSLPLVLASAAALLFAAVYMRSKLKKKKNEESFSRLPPGSTGWPLIGEVLSFSKSCPSTTLGDFMEQRISRFGKVFSTKLLSKKAIVSANAELNRFVMNNEPRMFESFLPEHMLPLTGDSDFHKGESNREFRAILTNFFCTARLQTSLVRDANELARKLLSDLLAVAGSSDQEDKVVRILDVAEQFTLDLFVKNVLSMEAGTRETKELGEHCERIVEGLFSFPVNLPGTQWNKALKSKKVVTEVMRRMVEERMSEDESTRRERGDLLECILRRNSMSKETISNLIQGVLFAGKSSSIGIGLVIYFLQDCPKALEQLREENLKIVKSMGQDGSNEITWDSYKKMDFTQCVINEALRLGNIARIAARKAIVDTQFKGYEIPLGCNVFTHIAAVHLDPSLFEDPLSFNPWRWQSDNGIKKSNNFMAFGGGTRLCPGAELARLEMAVFIHHFILNYNWKSEKHDKLMAFPRVKFPKGLPIRVYALS